LIKLHQDINNGTYKIGRSIAFVVKKPVQREIFAADFRDRIVHHLIIRKINHLFEKIFIDSSYSCRTGKGTLYGVRDIAEKIRRCSDLGKRECYVLKLDIQSFFMSIDKNILSRMLTQFLKKSYHAADKRIVLHLVKQIVCHTPENHCVRKGHLSEWNGLPCSKSLFWSPRDKGMAIGNLTSQIFANFYLNRLDQYVTQKLGLQEYGRYVDDFVIISGDKKALLAAISHIKTFLQQNLRLILNPHKIYLQTAQKGVKFVGAFIKPRCIYIDTRTKTNLYAKIRQTLPCMARNVSDCLAALPSFCSSVNSYLGFMRYYNTYRLRSLILESLKKTFLQPAILQDTASTTLNIDKIFLPTLQKQNTLHKNNQPSLIRAVLAF
jgi:hypothetical protein